MQKKILVLGVCVLIFVIIFPKVCAMESMELTDTVQITSDSITELNPCLFQDSDGKYWVAWHSDKDDDDNKEIWISSSTDGVSWQTPAEIIDLPHGYDAEKPCLAQDHSGTYWLVWERWTPDWWTDIMISSSQDGKNWGNPVQITTTITSDIEENKMPSLCIDSNGKFWVAWASYRSGMDATIWVKSSVDGINWGSWETDIQVTTTDGLYPSIIQDNNREYMIAYHDPGDGIWLVKSSDGITWGQPTKIVEGSYYMPSLLQDSAGTYWVTYNTIKLPSGDVFISSSIDGVNWSSPKRITTYDGLDWQASIIQSSSDVYKIVWSSKKGGNQDIWIGDYKAVSGTENDGGESNNSEKEQPKGFIPSFESTYLLAIIGICAMLFKVWKKEH